MEKAQRPTGQNGTFPGFTYQLGNFFASKNGTIQTTLAVSFGNNYGLALAITAAIVAIAVAVVTALSIIFGTVSAGDCSCALWAGTDLLPLLAFILV